MIGIPGNNYLTTSGEMRQYSDTVRKDARRATGKKTGWQVAELWDKHHEIARRLVLGQSNVEIAEELRVSAQQVSNVRNSPPVKEKIEILRAVRDAGTVNLANEIADLAPVALQRIKEALQTGTVIGKDLSASGILREANNLLDREMGRATQRIDTRNIHGHFTLEDIERIKAKAEELK